MLVKTFILMLLCFVFRTDTQNRIVLSLLVIPLVRGRQLYWPYFSVHIILICSVMPSHLLVLLSGIPQVFLDRVYVECCC